MVGLGTRLGAEDVVLDDRNGSFQNQSDEASTSKRSSRRASVEAVSAWAELRPYVATPLSTAFSTRRLLKTMVAVYNLE